MLSRTGLLVGITMVVSAALLFGSLVFARHQRTAGHEEFIEVSRGGCGHGPLPHDPGPQTVTVRNTGAVTATVQLVDPSSGAVYGEVEALGSGTSRPMRVNLGNGSYAFRCAPDETRVSDGPRFRITGAHGPGSLAVAPVTKNDLLRPLREYKDYLTHGLDVLLADTQALAGTSDRAAAERAWLTAHQDYGRLGGAYDAFGDLGDAIDGRADGHQGGVTDPEFTGFHRVEYALWHGKPMSEVASWTARLLADVRSLRGELARMQVDPKDFALRAHEISEDAIQFELTGASDYGSGTSLATVSANLDGTSAVLDTLRGVLRDRYPGMSDVDTWLGKARSAVLAGRRADGGWTPLDALPALQRERINATLSELAERLAPVAAICAPRRIP